MKILLSAVGSICITIIAIGFFEAFFSNEQLKFPLKFVLGVIVLSAVIGAFSGGLPDFDELYTEMNMSDVNLEQTSAKGASNLISTILNKHGICNAKIKIDTSKNENDCIIFDKITIFTNEYKDKRNLEDKIHKLFDVETEVICE